MTQRRVYLEQYPYFVTTNTHGGEKLFDDEKYALQLSWETFVSSRIKRFSVLCYQIMPSHLHILVIKHGSRTLEKVRYGDGKTLVLPTERTLSSVRSTDNPPHTISDLMQSIKGNFSRKLHIGNIWQRRFYAKLINTDEYFRTIIEYIRFNPEKAGLPEIYHNVPYHFIDRKKIHQMV